MTRQIVVAAFLAMVLMRGVHGGEEGRGAVQPGTEVSLRWEPTGCDIPVYVPSDYTPEREWPAVFFYHGLNGAPSTGFVRGLTDGRGVVVVGMEYLERGLRQRTADENERYLERELAQLSAMRDAVSARISVDSGRLYVAGISKGGWQVARIAERGLPGFAGAMILIAGRFPSRDRTVSGLRGKPIYVGAGEEDGNNHYARMAAQYFSRNGAVVTWEEYAGRGHSVDSAAPRLHAWVETVLLGTDEANRAAAAAWLRACREDYEDIVEDDARAVFLESVVADPRFRWCRSRDRAGVEQELDRLRTSGEAARRRQAEKEFEKGLWMEQTAQRLRDLERALTVYREAAAKYKDTEAGERAETAAVRVAEHVAEGRNRLRHTVPGVPRLRIR